MRHTPLLFINKRIILLEALNIEDGIVNFYSVDKFLEVTTNLLFLLNYSPSHFLWRNAVLLFECLCEMPRIGKSA